MYSILPSMQPMGDKIRRARRRLAMSLDDLSAKVGISKAYLSLIETGRVLNPPSDEKLERLERALNFAPGELVSQAHLQRTPRDVRAVLHRLIRQGQSANPTAGGIPDPADVRSAGPVNLDDVYLSGVLQEWVDRTEGNIEPLSVPPRRVDSSNSSMKLPVGVAAQASVPVINKVSAGYPSDFTDLGYPPRVADQFIIAPGVDDPDAFACRVHGDSMSPKYTAGDIVVFSPAAPWKDGADCFVRFEDGRTTFKRVYAESDAAGQEMLRLQPRNDRYKPQVIAREAIAGLYRAVSVYRGVDE